MIAAPDTIKTNFMWDHDTDGEPVAVRVVGHNTGHLEEIVEEDCGCVRAVYVLDDCGGPADLLLRRCSGPRVWACSGEQYALLLSAWTIEVTP